MVEKQIFQTFVTEVIIPFFSGTKIISDNEPLPLRNRSKLVTQCPRKGANYQKLMPSEKADYCLSIQRSLPFSHDEISFLQLFLKAAEEINIYKDMDKAYFLDRINSLTTFTIAKTLGFENISYQVIYNMINWSQQTYEGQNIAMCIGIDATLPQDGNLSNVSFNDIVDEDFLKVLSNGYDTMIQLDKNGIFYNLMPLKENNDEKVYAPFRFSKVARWTAGNQNIAFVLNRNGEILIFKNGELTFARRNGKWFFYSHMQAIKKIAEGTGRSFPADTREAIYLTALDVAFSRTGGCIGFVKNNKKSLFNQSSILLEENNFNASKMDAKTKVLYSIVDKKKFHEIPRLLRMELAAIDGATLISREEKFISIGAILRLHDNEVSSTGGGRTLAAMSLGKFGLGIKISNDGYIKFYTDSSDPILEIN